MAADKRDAELAFPENEPQIVKKRLQSTKSPNVRGECVAIFASNGTSSMTLHVHQELLVQDSPFAAARLDPKWTDTQGRTIKLEETDPVAVECYVKWLYTKRVASWSDDPLLDDEWKSIIKLYFLGAFLQSYRFCNDVMISMCEKIMQKDQGIMLGMASEIYTHTGLESPLRRFIVDVHIYLSKGVFVAKASEIGRFSLEHKVDFLKDAFQEMLNWKASEYSNGTKPNPKFWGPWTKRYLLPVPSTPTQPKPTTNGVVGETVTPETLDASIAETGTGASKQT